MKNIVVLDNNFPTVKYFLIACEYVKANIKGFTSPKEAFDYITKNKVHAVFIDKNLECDIDGVQFAHMLEKFDSSILRICYTSFYVGFDESIFHNKIYKTDAIGRLPEIVSEILDVEVEKTLEDLKKDAGD